MIRGITFAEQAFYSADFAHYQNFFLNRQCGITKGCQITQDGTAVTIGTGYFIAHGRMMNVEEAEIVSNGFAEGYNRIVYEIDLSQENTIEEFKQGRIRVLNTEMLTQEDLDADGLIYQMPFCSFQWDGSAISDFIINAPTLVLDNIFSDISANFETVNAQFRKWFDDQAEVIDKMVKDLEGEGFEKASVETVTSLFAANWDTEIKIYSFEEEYPAASYDIEIEPIDCTKEQAAAWSKSVPMGSSEANALTALGEVPVIDIPILLSVKMK